MTLKIHRTGAADYGQHIKALICGEPGAGKTLISSTFPNPLYASAEGGLMSIADRDIPYIEITASDQLLNLKNVLDQDPAAREAQLGFPVDTVVIDTIDEIQRIFIAERLKETKKDSLALQDWGWLGERMQAVVRGFRNLPMNVVFTCHIKEVNDSESGRVWHKPAMQGGIAEQIPGYVDLSLLIETTLTTKIVDGKTSQVEEKFLVSRPSHQFPFLKDRSGKLPPSIEVNFEDDYERVNKLIFGGIHLKEGAVFEVQTGPPVVPVTEPKPEPVKVESKPEVPVESKVAPVEPPVAGKPTLDLLGDGKAKKEPEKQAEALLCEECGDPIESDDQAALSRIRFRMKLDKKCFDKKKR